MGGGVSSKLFGGISLQAVLLVVVSLQQLVLVPVFLMGWGPELYRDWLVLLAMTEFLVLLDMGMQVYYGNALMQRFSSGDLRGYRQTLAEACGVNVLLLGLGSFLIGGYALVQDWLNVTGYLGVSPALETTLLWLAWSVVLRLPLGLLGGVYRARGEPARSVAFALIQVLTGLVFVVALVLMGFGAEAVAILLTISTVALVLLGMLDQWWRYQEPWPIPVLPSRADFWTALTTGGAFNVQALAVVMNVQGMVLMVSSLASDALSLILFTTIRTLTGLGSQISVQLATMVSVEQSREQGKGRMDTLLKLHHFVLRLSTAVAAGVAGFLLIVGEDLMQVWTHGEVPFHWGLAALMFLAGVLSSPVRAASQLFRYTNRPGHLVRGFAMEAVIAVSMAYLLIPMYGVLGAGIAIVIAAVISMTGFLGYRLAEAVGDRWLRQTVFSMGFASLCLVLSGVVTWGLHSWLGEASWTRLIFIGFLWSAVAVVAAYFLVLDRVQREQFGALLGAIFRHKGS